MNNDEKARVLDYMKTHAETLLNGEVKNIDSYSAETIILARFNAKHFLKGLEEAKERLSLTKHQKDKEVKYH